MTWLESKELCLLLGALLTTEEVTTLFALRVTTNIHVIRTENSIKITCST
jgi:hypothetical protein